MSVAEGAGLGLLLLCACFLNFGFVFACASLTVLFLNPPRAKLADVAAGSIRTSDSMYDDWKERQGGKHRSNATPPDCVMIESSIDACFCPPPEVACVQQAHNLKCIAVVNLHVCHIPDILEAGICIARPRTVFPFMIQLNLIHLNMLPALTTMVCTPGPSTRQHFPPPPPPPKWPSHASLLKMLQAVRQRALQPGGRCGSQSFCRDSGLQTSTCATGCHCMLCLCP